MSEFLPKVNVQSCNCTENSDSPNFDIQTRSFYDSCYNDYETVQSIRQGAYGLQNFKTCDCGASGPKSVAFSQPNINYQGKTGWGGEGGCLIDNDSILRYEDKLTNLKTVNQLFTRPYLTVPFMGKGVPHTEDETELQFSEQTGAKRSCNVLSGVSIDNFFTPMIDTLKTNVQNTKYLIPEDSREDWVRGGLSTRALVRNYDYKQRCN